MILLSKKQEKNRTKKRAWFFWLSYPDSKSQTVELSVFNF